MHHFAPAPSALPFPHRVGDLYSHVFDAILEQRIDAASRFTEESLAQLFSARRSEIRGVLTRLSHEHVIVLRANHRPRVAALDTEQTRQMLHARRLTEITLVRLACQSRPQDLNPLQALIDSERHCTERGTAIRLSGEFHLQLAQMAGNAPLAHFLGSLVPLTSLAIAQVDAQVVGYCDWQVHQGILDAVERRDSVMAVTAGPAFGSFGSSVAEPHTDIQPKSCCWLNRLRGQASLLQVCRRPCRSEAELVK